MCLFEQSSDHGIRLPTALDREQRRANCQTVFGTVIDLDEEQIPLGYKLRQLRGPLNDPLLEFGAQLSQFLRDLCVKAVDNTETAARLTSPGLGKKAQCDPLFPHALCEKSR